MSVDYGNLASVVIAQCFGSSVQAVADCLFASTSRTVANIVTSTKLSWRNVCEALAVLIKFQLVGFRAVEGNAEIAEYFLKREDILHILRFPRYVRHTRAKYDETGVAILEEILHAGSQTATNIIVNCISRGNNSEKPETYRDTIFSMISDKYLIMLPSPVVTSENEVPSFQIESVDLFRVPDVNLKVIAQIIALTSTANEAPDNDIYWRVNCNRFHQDFRDTVMIDAIERKLGVSAADCFKYILKLMYERTEPWERRCSNPFTFVELKQAIEKKSNNLDLMRYLDHYVSLIVDDSLGFVRKIGDMGGGQYIVELQHAFEELALACIENVITERFGSKAARIFRVIRFKKFIEQEDLQKEAMIPAKEAKLLSYNLFQEQFLHIKTIRKAGGGGAGPAKAFYLFHLKQKNIVRMLLDICFKALYNAMTRSNFEQSDNKRLIEKSQKLESIVVAMRHRGDTEEYINDIAETLTPPEKDILAKVKARIKALSKAELKLDDTIFLLQMYMHHSAQTTAIVK